MNVKICHVEFSVHMLWHSNTTFLESVRQRNITDMLSSLCLLINETGDHVLLSLCNTINLPTRMSNTERYKLSKTKFALEKKSQAS